MTDTTTTSRDLVDPDILATQVTFAVEQALWGCEGGGLIDNDDTSVPVGEYRRLLWEEAKPAVARVIAAGDPTFAASHYLGGNVGTHIEALRDGLGWDGVLRLVRSAPATNGQVTDLARDVLAAVITALATEADLAGELVRLTREIAATPARTEADQ